MAEGAESAHSSYISASKTEGGDKLSPLKDFTALTAPERVKAVPATVKDPITQDLAYKFADITPDTLTDKEEEAVDLVFRDPRLQQNRNKQSDVQTYRIDPKQKEAIFQELGIQSYTVDIAIADFYMKRLRPG